MLTVLCIPTTPQVIERIHRGQQAALIRRVPPKKPYHRIWLFVKSPVPTVVMECLPNTIHTLPKPQLFDCAFPASGMTLHQWRNYLADKTEGTAIFLQHAELLPADHRFNLVDRLGLKQTPESHIYTIVNPYPFGRPLHRPEATSDSLFEAPTDYPD